VPIGIDLPCRTKQVLALGASWRSPGPPDGLQRLLAPADKCHEAGHFSGFKLQKCLSVYPLNAVS